MLYEIKEIKKLLDNCNESNKKVIIETLKNIIDEDENVNIELINIEKINNIFLKNTENEKIKCDFCNICKNRIKSKEHKIKLNICDHIFHKKCLNKILKDSLTDFSCPTCHTNYKSQLESIAFNIINK